MNWNVAIIIVGIGVLVGRNGKVGLSSESSLKLFDLKKSLKELRIKSEHDPVLNM